MAVKKVRKITKPIRPVESKPEEEVLEVQEPEVVEDESVEEDEEEVSNETEEDEVEETDTEEENEEEQPIKTKEKTKSTTTKKKETKKEEPKEEKKSNKKVDKKLINPLNKEKDLTKAYTLDPEEKETYTRKDLIHDVALELAEKFNVEFNLDQTEAIIKTVENVLEKATDNWSVRFMNLTIKHSKRNAQVSAPPKANFKTYKEERYVKSVSADIGQPALYGGDTDKDGNFVATSQYDYETREYKKLSKKKVIEIVK